MKALKYLKRRYKFEIIHKRERVFYLSPNEWNNKIALSTLFGIDANTVCITAFNKTAPYNIVGEAVWTHHGDKASDYVFDEQLNAFVYRGNGVGYESAPVPSMTDRTLECLVKRTVDKATYSHGFVCLGDESGKISISNGFGSGDPSGIFFCGVNAPGPTVTSSPNVWHLFSYSVKGTNHYYFMDGKLIERKSINQSIGQNKTVLIDSSSYYRGGCSSAFEIGLVVISNICRYEKDFSAQQISVLNKILGN